MACADICGSPWRSCSSPAVGRARLCPRGGSAHASCAGTGRSASPVFRADQHSLCSGKPFPAATPAMARMPRRPCVGRPPSGVVSFALIATDPTPRAAPGPLVMANLPGDARALAEALPQTLSLPAAAGRGTIAGTAWLRRALSTSGATHHYVFTLYALDALLDLAAVLAARMCFRPCRPTPWPRRS